MQRDGGKDRQIDAKRIRIFPIHVTSLMLLSQKAVFGGWKSCSCPERVKPKLKFLVQIGDPMLGLAGGGVPAQEWMEEWTDRWTQNCLPPNIPFAA